MSALATKRLFGHKAAEVGDDVILAAPRHDRAPGVCLRAGKILAISAKEDVPWIVDFGDLAAGPAKGRPAEGEVAPGEWRFVPRMNRVTVEDEERFPLGSWTWKA